MSGPYTILIVKCRGCGVITAGAAIFHDDKPGKDFKSWVGELVIEAAKNGRNIAFQVGGEVTLGSTCKCKEAAK